MRRFIPFVEKPPLIAVVRLQGAIGVGARGMSDAGMASAIERAFGRGKPAAIALQINSPGGSPTQSALIAARIRRLADEKKVPVFAFVEDVAASGGYWLATAGDEIIVDANSITGSIGVISASFGLHEFIGKHGIERRVHSAGQSKSFMDPFRPEKPEDVQRLEALQKVIHDNFIDQVKARRGSKLREGVDLFTGDIWVGRQAVDLGLADAVGHLIPTMKERFGEKTRFAVYGPKRGLLRRLGAETMNGVVGAVEDRAMWARFGL
ncbi:S49 family peptidase [Vannielia litorea]|uniref:S49 family peptidase n=1 Tax=Vannielia litorea TaxID=1217970 RepID=UPI001C95ED65|nr:S49 family peptidase [Vannielia litorea]MBY6049257.1 S49 family peptidase [Vannielia litorea]MBY6076671.1 S49 family peptidase [Vannielia litorea]